MFIILGLGTINSQVWVHIGITIIYISSNHMLIKQIFKYKNENKC